MRTITSRELMRRARARWKDQGLCIGCGKDKPYRGGKCEQCCLSRYRSTESAVRVDRMVALAFGEAA